MAALRSRCGHYIFALWFLLSFYLSFFFPRLISAAVADWMSIPYFHTWCGLSANLGRRSETCCTRLAEIKDAKNCQKSPSGHRLTTLSGYRLFFATKAHIDNRKNNLLNSNTSSTRPHNMANFGPLTAKIASGVLGTQANFNGFRVLSARHSGSGRQPNFAALNRGRRLSLYLASRPSRWALAHILVTNTNLPPILHRFRDIAFDRSKIAIFGYTPLALNRQTEGLSYRHK